MKFMIRHSFSVAALALLLLAQPSSAWALAANSTLKLVPHRAVYEMTLDTARSGSGITGIAGRMVFEFSGSACEGFTLNMRLVTNVTDRKGNTAITDMRSSSWERGDGMRFRFNSSQYRNRRLSEVTTGDASRADNDDLVSVHLQKPAKSDLKFPGEVLFPTQHSLLLLNAAHEGKFIVQADVYDGSDKGDKVFATTAFIGKPRAPGADDTLPAVKNAAKLDELVSWPVSISYFEPGQIGEALPSYEISFRLFGNGVSRKLLIDYGGFAIRGELSELEFLQSSECP